MFYFKLSKENIKKNKRLYIPYGIVKSIIVVIFYIMASVMLNENGKSVGGESLQRLMMFGVIITAIFSTIFLIYINSFLMKKRKTELGLYNILGLNKNHIIKLVLIERIIISFITITLGIILGIIFGKIIFLFLLKLIKVSEITSFGVSIESILLTIILFTGINLIMGLIDTIEVKRSNIIKLLKSKNVGEREPKGKIIIGLIGLVSLGVGYYNAYTVENPVLAMNSLFFNIVLVMIGLYLLFTSGSIIILKFLRKRKNIYYKEENFITIGTMIYRMKKNAVGLANICILGTGVVLALSTSLTLYITSEKMLQERYPNHIDITLRKVNLEEIEKAKNTLNSIEREDIHETLFTGGPFIIDGENFIKTTNAYNSVGVNFIPNSTYNKEAKKDVLIKEDEVLVYSKNVDYKEKFVNYEGKKYKVEKIDDIGSLKSENEEIMDSITMIMSDNFFKKDLYYATSFDLKDAENLPQKRKEIEKSLRNLKIKDLTIQDKETVREDFNDLYGGFLFMGLLISIVFLFGTILIIYYKQISEGFDDKERFNIMKKVGLEDKKIKKIIRKQVFTVFMLPCIFTGINLFFAYPMIEKILILLNLTETEIFPLIIGMTMIIYLVSYLIIYNMTSKVYYKIVK
ncbi:MAG: ABC transporter permease [Clostridium sp.]|uniref:ABC transporter permease n=1 Tax=Clostridium sp. TaxID=1506 RepID=UPI003F3B2E68